jgi:hypothetical protein
MLVFSKNGLLRLKWKLKISLFGAEEPRLGTMVAGNNSLFGFYSAISSVPDRNIDRERQRHANGLSAALHPR